LERDTESASTLVQWVERAQRGEREAFEHLYRENVGRVYALCLRLAADAMRAQELTQDAFVRAWTMLGSFRGDSAFSSWLHRVTLNVVFEDMRSQRRRKARFRSTDDFAEFDRPGASAIPGLEMDLEKAIAALPPQARMIFVLYDVEGFRHEEIARLMGLSVGTSKAQLHRARRLLREALGK